MNPTRETEREPVLDALRGFAILGILLVNIELMRGSDWLVLTAGEPLPTTAAPEAIARFVVGWLAAGKFISSLAILFGVGTAIIAARAERSAASPYALLARRYFWLMPFGLAHMLLYPGDILFVYGVAGLMLWPFIRLPARILTVFSVVLFAGFSALALLYLRAISRPGASSGDTSGDVAPDDSARELLARTTAAYAEGGFADIFSVHVSQAVLLQIGQLYVLPWILALFMFGLAIGRAGIVQSFRAQERLLEKGAIVGITAGLLANLGLGYGGPLSGYGPSAEPVWVTIWIASAQLVGAPVLAVGYLCALGLYFVRRGVPRPLAAVGRMALTAYILQSALALAVFGGLRLYDALSAASGLIAVVAIWAVILILCPLWLRAFELGPLEWLWRSLAYGRIQKARHSLDLS